MIIQVETNQSGFEIGDYVAFITGKKSINTFPSYLRIGRVISVSESTVKTVDEVEELSTGKIFKPYSTMVIKVGSGIAITGIAAQLVTTEKIQ